MLKLIVTIIFSTQVILTLNASERVVVSNWLMTGPFEVNYPVFYDTENVEGETFTDRRLLLFDHLDLTDYYPAEDKTVQWLNGENGTWQPLSGDASGYVTIDSDLEGDKPGIAYLAAYIRTDRWMNVRLELASPYMFEAWLNGEKIGTKSTIEQNDKKQNGNGNNDDEDPGTGGNGQNGDGEDDGGGEAEAGENDNDRESIRDSYGKVTHPVELERGTHLLIIKALRPPDATAEWELMGRIRVEDPFAASDIYPAISPETIKDIRHIMDGIFISSVRPSPDGSLYAISYRRSLPPSGRSETWTDIRRFSDDALVHSFRHASISRLGWLPGSNAVSYTTVRDGRTSVYLHDMERGEKQVLMEDISNFAGMRWSPDESYLVYTIREEGTGADATMRHIQGMQDRQAHFRHRSFLYKLDVSSGVRTRLTHGRQSTSVHDISNDGSRLVFSQTYPDYQERPFYKHDYFMLDMHNLVADTLIANKRWGVSFQFSPDGNYLLATGGPSAFDRIGENIPEGMIANNYDTQAYIYSLADGNVNPITRNFDPSVVSAHWHGSDGHIYFVAGEEDYRRLFRYNVRRERFDRIDTGTDFLSAVHFASKANVATYTGNMVNAPPKAYRLNLRNDNHTVLEDPGAERYQHVLFGEVRDWNFTASTGNLITGRYYLPPDFDPERKYPVIVYQYGGTNPVGRSFGGRYPFNLWAGNGYIVYVLQPAGATGFGQAFSAAHVNNWGKTVAGEIIEGTRKFLEAHPFADPDRVGVAGASYGGFMTMLLLTETDIYTTAISHAGISNITSYWGEGYWGYSYSAEATARSFPWDSQEIYVDQSPLFKADRITTPLLLVTGDSDTNVPPGESIQMYTALKLLGRPVELILVKGEDHHILTYNRRIEWHKAIMAWWDKYLKDQPEWWEEQYPKKYY